MRQSEAYRNVPADLMKLRHVALSRDGEPTLCPNFTEAVHVRARGQFPFFKIVLLSNASGLDLPAVQNGLQFFTGREKIWAKLDAGTSAYMGRDLIRRIHVLIAFSALTRACCKSPYCSEARMPTSANCFEKPQRRSRGRWHPRCLFCHFRNSL